MELRARFACGLQSAAYAVELACDERRALKLAADDNFHVAIVASGSSCASLAMLQQLCDRVPEMIVLAEGPDELARWRRSLSGARAFFLKTVNESAVITRVGETTACADGEALPGSNILCIDDCRLDFAGRVFVDGCGREVSLTRAESKLLKELASSPCQVLSRETLRRATGGAPNPSIAALTCSLLGFGARSNRLRRLRGSWSPSRRRIKTHGSAAEC